MNELLMQVVVEVVIFFELSEEDIIDPDVAVSQLEQIASILQGLKQEERNMFIHYIRKLAQTEQNKLGKTERVEALLSLPDGLGLED